jgi:hypothetical protein
MTPQKTVDFRFYTDKTVDAGGSGAFICSTAWQQGSPVSTFSRHIFCLRKLLFNPCYMHIEFLLVNFSVLNRNEV